MKDPEKIYVVYCEQCKTTINSFKTRGLAEHFVILQEDLGHPLKIQVLVDGVVQ